MTRTIEFSSLFVYVFHVYFPAQETLSHAARLLGKKKAKEGYGVVILSVSVTEAIKLWGHPTKTFSHWPPPRHVTIPVWSVLLESLFSSHWQAPLPYRYQCSWISHFHLV
ncbi:Uncharacterized protein TCM_010126 [Theobroma cacao]|uniref:Uncharacterized protein n=1 Tax=Theobroma cacao TaxID=3641 RepID=A0A061E7F6_THECC|nr:Uncharacterized protein TCM_010126 [Theobroma cacao]